MLKLPLASLAYAAMFHYAYFTYVNPLWEYAHYTYFSPSWAALLFTYALVVAPVVSYRDSSTPAAYGAALLFALCYAPAQLILLFTWQRSGIELTVLQASLAASMAVLLRASAYGAGVGGPAYSDRRLAPPLAALTLVSLVLLVLTYRQNMRLVGFDEVYDLRFESDDLAQGALAGYLMSWLSYCFLPFYFARGILKRNLGDIGIGLVGAVLVYAATGSKAVILMPLLMLGLNLLLRKQKDFLFRLVVVLTVAVLLIIELLPDDGALRWIKSLLLIRILGTGGWTMAVYYDYFATRGFTFYTHIGPINALTGAYPYGEYSLGQLIGLEYTASELANFNANFWASDAFAAMGILGIPVATLGACAVFIAVNRLSRGYSSRFVALWLTGFWLAMLNVPLTTALLSGGGAITLLLLWYCRVPLRRLPRPGRPRTHRREPAHAAPEPRAEIRA